MPAFLMPYLIKFAPWIVVVVLIVGSVLYVHHLKDQLQVAHEDVAAAQGTIAQLRGANQQNLAALKRLEDENARWQNTLDSTIAVDGNVTRFTNELVTAIAEMPTKDDAPVSPVLAMTLAAISKEQGKKP